MTDGKTRRCSKKVIIGSVIAVLVIVAVVLGVGFGLNLFGAGNINFKFDRLPATTATANPLRKRTGDFDPEAKTLQSDDAFSYAYVDGWRASLSGMHFLPVGSLLRMAEATGLLLPSGGPVQSLLISVRELQPPL